MHRVGLLYAAHDRADRVVGLGGRPGVEVVRGAGDRGRVDQRTGAVDVERHVVLVGAEPAPADQVAAVRVDADHAPVQGLDLACGGGLGGSGGERGESGGGQDGGCRHGQDLTSAVPVRVRVLHVCYLLRGQTVPFPQLPLPARELPRRARSSPLTASGVPAGGPGPAVPRYGRRARRRRPRGSRRGAHSGRGGAVSGPARGPGSGPSTAFAAASARASPRARGVVLVGFPGVVQPVAQLAPCPGARSSTRRASAKSSSVTAPPTLWVFTVRETVW